MKNLQIKYYREKLSTVLLSLVLVLTPCANLTGQIAEIDSQFVHFDNLNVNQGLHAGYVYNLWVDRAGYLWVMTNLGLQKYDGYSFTNYTYNFNDKFSAPVSGFRGILEDSQGNLWLRNVESEVFIFERSTERFIKLDLEMRRLYSIDAMGRLWFLNINDELCYLDLNQLAESTVFADGVVDKNSIHLLHPKGRKLNPRHSQVVFHPNGELWLVADYELGIYEIDYTKDKIDRKYRHQLGNKGYEKMSGHQPFLFIHQDTEEPLLFFSSSYCRLNPKSGATQECIEIPNYKFPKPQIFDDEGKLWLTTQSGRILTYDFATSRFKELKRDNSTLKSTSNINGLKIVKDKHRNLWISTNGFGIYKYSNLKSRFQYFGEDHKGPAFALLRSLGKSPFLKAAGYIGFFDSQNNDFINIDHIVESFNCNDWHYLHINISQDSLWNTTFVLPCEDPFECYEVNINRAGELVSSIKRVDCTSSFDPYVKNVVLHQGKSYEISSLCSNSASVPCQLRVAVSDFYQDASSNTSNSTIVYDTLFEGIAHRSSYAFAGGDFWFGSINAGLIRFNTDALTWHHYNHDRSDSLSLSSSKVYQPMADPNHPDSLLWIATDNGINLMEINIGKFHHIKKEDGLPNNVINAMLVDHKKNIWVSTNNGLAHINYKSKEISSFYRSDGLQHNEFNVQAATMTDDSLFYFAGMGGLTYFDPKVFYKDSLKSKVVISDFRIFNESIPFEREGLSKTSEVHLNKPIDQAQTIVLDYDKKMISFSFSILDLTDPKRNEYRYKLVGFDKKWIEQDTRNQVTFTNLQPGTYTLKVQGKNYSGAWSEVNDKVRIKILAPWWMTWWFKTLSLLAIIGIIYGVFKYRNRQKEKIQKLRNRISKDLHDEIGSTISSIALYSTVAEKKIDPSQKEVHSVLTRINESSTSVMESMNDIVWTINSGNENFREIVNRLRAFTSELIHSGTKVEYDIQSNLLEKAVGMIVKRNIYLIIKEAINNANKYAEASLIVIKMMESKGRVNISVSDDGVGFDLENINKHQTLGGNGLRNMESRTKEIGGEFLIMSKEKVGTTINFSFNTK